MKKVQYFVLLAMIITGSSCNKLKEISYSPVSDSTEIRIGVLLPLTGSGSSSGEAIRVALDFAQQDIAGYFESAGIKRKVVLSIADTRTDTAEALGQLTTFYSNGIRLIIGPYSSAELIHIKSFADSRGMLVVSPSSVAVSLSIPGDNIFRFVSSDVIQGKAITKMLQEDKIKVIIPLVRDDLWGNDLVAATGADFIKNGGSVQPLIRYNPGSTDFSSVLKELDTVVGSELSHHNPNEVAVYMLSFAEGTNFLAEAKKYTNLNNVYWYGGSAFALNSSLPGDTNAAHFAYSHGLPCPVYGLDDAAKSRWQPLKDKIREKIGREPEVYSITAYDALWVLVRTDLLAGDRPPVARLRNIFVSEADDYFGASGNTQLDENGDRAVGNYDFWAMKTDSAGYCWKRVARYNSFSGTLVRFAN